MPKATIAMQEGGAIIFLSPHGTVSGSLIDDERETRGVLLARGLLRCVENEQWVDEVCRKIREGEGA